VNAVTGETWCRGCARLLDTNQLISEVQFRNNTVVGTFVHDGLVRGPNAQNDSKELRLRRALDKVQEIGSQLELGGRIIDAGQRYYKLAVYYNFVQGRSI